ncbi:MAG TPA: hypothetical protein VHD63_27740 [Ktedonobacteraceae bacterium]|nr:hypothetical protein [Ktedonobacteraceae bacterium]
MYTPVPAAVQPLLEAYIRALEPLHEHVYGIYHPEQLSLYRFSWARMRDTLALMRYGRQRGGKALDASGLRRDAL